MKHPAEVELALEWLCKSGVIEERIHYHPGTAADHKIMAAEVKAEIRALVGVAKAASGALVALKSRDPASLWAAQILLGDALE